MVAKYDGRALVRQTASGDRNGEERIPLKRALQNKRRFNLSYERRVLHLRGYEENSGGRGAVLQDLPNCIFCRCVRQIGDILPDGNAPIAQGPDEQRTSSRRLRR